MNFLKDRGWKTPEELAQADLHRHLTGNWDLNPFSTDGARCLWQSGFDGEPFNETWGTYDSENARIYARGQAAAKLVKEA